MADDSVRARSTRPSSTFHRPDAAISRCAGSEANATPGSASHPETRPRGMPRESGRVVLENRLQALFDPGIRIGMSGLAPLDQ